MVQATLRHELCDRPAQLNTAVITEYGDEEREIDSDSNRSPRR